MICLIILIITKLSPWLGSLHNLPPEQQVHTQPSSEQGLQHHEFDAPLQCPATILYLHKEASGYDQGQEAQVILSHASKEVVFWTKLKFEVHALCVDENMSEFSWYIGK